MLQGGVFPRVFWVLRVLKGLRVSRVFQETFKVVSKKFLACFTEVSKKCFKRIIQGCKKWDILVFKNSTSYPDILELKISICMSKYFRGVYIVNFMGISRMI